MIRYLSDLDEKSNASETLYYISHMCVRHEIRMQVRSAHSMILGRYHTCSFFLYVQQSTWGEME